MDCGRVAVIFSDRSIWSQATAASDQLRGLGGIGAAVFEQEATVPTAVCEISECFVRAALFLGQAYAYEVLIRHRRPVTSVTDESDSVEKAAESGRFYLGRSTAVRPGCRARCTIR